MVSVGLQADAKPPKRGMKDYWFDAQSWVKAHPREFGFGAFAILSFLFLFWPLFATLPYVWFNDNSYYAHGPVIPFFVAIIIWDRMPELKKAKIKGVGGVLFAIVPVLYITWFIMRTGAYAMQSVLLILLLLLSFLYILGWQFTKLLAIPTLFLAFGLPNVISALSHASLRLLIVV